MTLFDPFPDSDCPEGVGAALKFMREKRNICPKDMAIGVNALSPYKYCEAGDIERLETWRVIPEALDRVSASWLSSMVKVLHVAKAIPEALWPRVRQAYFADQREEEIAPAPIIAIENKKHELAVRAHRGTAFSTFLTPTTQEMQFLAYNLKQIITKSDGEQIRLPKCLQSNHHAIIHSNALHDLFTPGKSLASNEATTTLIEIVNTFADFLRDHHHMERETVDNFRRDGLALVELIDKAREATREEYRQWHNNPRIHTR